MRGIHPGRGTQLLAFTSVRRGCCPGSFVRTPRALLKGPGEAHMCRGRSVPMQKHVVREVRRLVTGTGGTGLHSTEPPMSLLCSEQVQFLCPGCCGILGCLLLLEFVRAREGSGDCQAGPGDSGK